MTDTTQLIPINKLRVSDANVRTANVDLKITELAANIAAVGLMQALTVVPLKKPRGHYAVVAGGRRYRAICHNVEKNYFAKDHLVECKVRSNEENLTELSFAENFQRENMTPADEITTFGKLHDEGMEPDQIAIRFGLTRRHIDARLKLSNLIPEIIDLIRDGSITLEKASAFAQAETEDAQRQYLSTMRHYSASQIQNAILQNSLEGTSPIALYVTAEAYAAAGGTTTLDLLEPEKDIWNDKHLAETLATEKLNAAAEAYQKETGLGWVVPILSTSVSYMETQKFHRIHIPNKPLSEEDEATYQNLCDQISELEDQAANCEDHDKYNDIDTKIDELTEQQEALENKGKVDLQPDTKARLGTFLHLDRHGNAVAADTLYGEDHVVIGNDGGIVEKTKKTDTSTDTNGPTTPTGTPGLSAKLNDELKLQRRDVLAAHLTSNPEIALNYMIFTLADRKMSYSTGESGTTLAAPSPNEGAGQYPSGPAREHIEAMFEHLDKTWASLPSKTARFDAFTALDYEKRIEWAAYSMACSLNAIEPYGSRKSYAIHAHLAGLMEIDFAAMWRPTANNYFGRVKKDLVLDALEQVGGPVLRDRYATAKKSELAATAEKIFSGDAIVEPEIKEAALKWVPDGMTFADADTPKEGNDIPGNDDELSPGAVDDETAEPENTELEVDDSDLDVTVAD